MDLQSWEGHVRRAALGAGRRPLLRWLGASLLATVLPPRAVRAADCVPDCTSKTCGDNGCGGTCGLCETASRCTAQGTCVAIDDGGSHCRHVSTRRHKHARRTLRACTADFARVCQLFYGADAQTLADCAGAFASCCQIYRSCRNTRARSCLDETLQAFPRIRPPES